MEDYKIIRLESTDSTNNYAKNMPEPADDLTPVVVVTDNQTAGRGQRGNSWESEPGSNLTFSLVVYPRWMSPSRQFELSMIVSVGMVNALEGFVEEPEKLSVKWPNDIYFGDSKLAGILIENTIGENSIERSIIGIGLNVNQNKFHSDAPNPISLRQITGLSLDRDAILKKVVDSIVEMLDSYAEDPEVDQLTAMYNGMLWRKDNLEHDWLDTASNTRFRAVIEDVDPDGRLTLLKDDGGVVKYLFKEVAAVL